MGSVDGPAMITTRPRTSKAVFRAEQALYRPGPAYTARVQNVPIFPIGRMGEASAVDAWARDAARGYSHFVVIHAS